MGSRDHLPLWMVRKSQRTSNNCVPRSSRSRRLQLNPGRGRAWFLDSHWASGRPILFEVHLVLWKGMNPYRNFDGKELASFKLGKFSWGNDNASEGYILGSGISAMLPLFITGNKTFVHFIFTISQLLDELGRLFWGSSCMDACNVPSRHTINSLVW
jgi:hypothetical protein